MVEKSEIHIEKNFMFTYNQEANDDPNNPSNGYKTHVPSKKSGVTIGHGYDLKTQHKDEVKRILLKAGVDSNIVTELLQAVDKEIIGHKAEEFINKSVKISTGQEIKISEYIFELDVQRKIYNDVVKSYEQQTNKLLKEEKIVLDLNTGKYKIIIFLEDGIILWSIAFDHVYHGWSINLKVIEGIKDYLLNGSITTLEKCFEGSSDYRVNNRLKEVRKLKVR